MKNGLIVISVLVIGYLCFGNVCADQKMMCVDALFCKNVSIEYKIEKLNKFLEKNPELRKDVENLSKIYIDGDKIIKGLK